MSVIAVASSIAELVEKVKNAAVQWDKKRNTKEQLANFLGDDARTYLQILEDISSLAPSRVYPILEEIKGMPTKSQIDSVVAVSIDVEIKFTALLSYFIKLVRDCSLISKNEAFMKNLLETDGILFDFIKRMDVAYATKDTVKINEDFYGFFKLYSNQLVRRENKKKINAEVDNAASNIQLIRKKIVPNLSSNIISRENKKRFRESYEKLAKATKRISIKKPVDVEMHDYLLPELKPIVILLEEIMLDMEKQLKSQKYQRMHVTKK